MRKQEVDEDQCGLITEVIWQKDVPPLKQLQETIKGKRKSQRDKTEYAFMRDQIKSRIDYLESEDKFEWFMSFFRIHFALIKTKAKYLSQITDSSRRLNETRRAYRIIGNSIHDITRLWVGLISEALLRDGGSICSEHFIPRMISGKRCLEVAITKGENYSIEDFILSMYVACQVTRVKPEENKKLMSFQTLNKFISPNHSYHSAGIILTKVQDFKLPKMWQRMFDKYGLEVPEIHKFEDVVVGINNT